MPGRKHILIIGGTACGPKAAARARRCDPSARITIMEQRDSLSTATCGLPYYIGDVIKNPGVLTARQADYFHKVLGIEVMTATRALAVHPRAHTVEAISLKTERRFSLEYDKLVLAVGASPVVPALEGRELKGIFTLSSIADASAIRSYLTGLSGREVVIIGAGLMGLEMAEAFTTRGLKVTVIEALGWVLPALLDSEIAAHVERHLMAKGVSVRLGERVSGFLGDSQGHVRAVAVAGKEIPAGLVLLSIGVRPNTALAKEAGLSIGATGGISVDEYLRTSDPDIYAGGDCVEVTNRITRQKTLVPLGSTANRHGRIIGTNVTGGSETFPGVMGTAICKVFDLNVGRVGLSEAQAGQSGFATVSSLVPSFDHATYYPGAREIIIKLVADSATGRLLGGQAVGKGEIAKRIDVLATALSCAAKASDLGELDLGYAPPYNSALDPLHHAANVIRNKLAGHARGTSPLELKQKLESGQDFILLDVRSLREWQTVRLEAPQVRFIPLPELTARLAELPRDKEIITLCQSSVRAYQAQRMLEGAGFKNVSFLDGSLAAWPFDLKR